MGLSVVLLEEEDFVARAMTSVLGRDGHVVHRVATQEDAMSLAGCFDVAIIGLHAGAASGLDIALRLRRSGAVRRVVFLSPDLHSAEASDALRVGPVLSMDLEELRVLLGSWG